MNIIILILLCVSAYLLNELFSYADAKYEEWQAENRKAEMLKKLANNDILQHKVVKLYDEAEKCCLCWGYSPEKAEHEALKFIASVIHNNEVDNKYQLLKEGA